MKSGEPIEPKAPKSGSPRSPREKEMKKLPKVKEKFENPIQAPTFDFRKKGRSNRVIRNIVENRTISERIEDILRCDWCGTCHGLSAGEMQVLVWDRSKNLDKNYVYKNYDPMTFKEILLNELEEIFPGVREEYAKTWGHDECLRCVDCDGGNDVT
jgi:hypothetical protein